jgi:pyrimidine-nucleoside phosphorylase
MIGQSERVVPADRLMYGLRDVTATVESVPLITASILSKKFAEGAQSLVFDVKAGSGAFMKNLNDARELADSLYRTGEALGRKVSVLVSSMEQPLGHAVGNFLEVRESVETLRGGGPEDLRDLSVRLAAHMLLLGGLAPSIEAGEALARETLASGSAWQRFLQNVRDQGGDVAMVEDPERFAPAGVVKVLESESTGTVTSLDAFEAGMAAVLLGAGRSRQGEAVRPEVGVVLHKKVGDRVDAGEPLCTVHAAGEGAFDEAAGRLRRAFAIGEEPVGPPELFLTEIGV